MPKYSDRRSKKVSEDTIIIISSDHGHKDIEKTYSVLDYPKIMECLYMPVSLESRVVGFFVKENMKKDFEERFNKIFKEEFLNKHLLGYGDKHTKVDDFFRKLYSIIYF